MSEGRPAPGDARPRTLARPPGERYGPPAAPGGPAVDAAAQSSLAVRPNLLRGALFGLVAALGIGVLFAILVGILDLEVGLIALSVIGGWTIGVATRAGAWRKAVALPSRRLRWMAVALALVAWLAGSFGAYLFALLLRPDSSLTFAERLAQSSFLDWLAPQFGPLEVFEMLLLAGTAWYASRGRSAAGAGSGTGA